MKRRRILPAGVLALLLVIALAAIGLGYALWSKTLTIEGVVHTGEVDAEFVDAFTDDDNVVDDPDKDSGDTGECREGELTSCDPAASGRDPKPRYDKDVARCDASIDEEDPQIMYVTVENAYPSYFCTVWAHTKNSGTIPVKFQDMDLTAHNFTPGVEITVDIFGVDCGFQLDPGEEVQEGGWLHVEQAAEENHSYTATIEVDWVQWNEYDAAKCQ